MILRRLPAFLPNLSLKLLPLSQAQQEIYDKTGFLRDLTFKTTPQATKVRHRCSSPRGAALCRSAVPLPGSQRRCLVQAEVKSFLQSVYGVVVDSVRTLNVEGKKKRSKQGYYRRSDYKKVFVTLKEPEAGSS